MQFIILGSSPGLPQLDKHLSSLYVCHQGTHLLFDCGEGCSRQLLRYSLDKDLLDAIIFSHYYLDHFSGIFMLIQMLYLQQRQKTLHLYLPEREDDFEALLNLQYTFRKRLSYRQVIHPMEDLPIHYHQFMIQSTNHLHGYSQIIQDLPLSNTMQSWAFQLGESPHRLVSTSDIQQTDCITSFLDCHTIIIDALHPEASQITSLAELPIPRVILTHGISEELSEWMAAQAPASFEFAEEGKHYYIND